MARRPGSKISRTGAIGGLVSPLNVPPMKKDVTPGYNVPPPMSPKDPLGYIPRDSMDRGSRRGR